MVLVALFVIVAAVAKKQQNQENQENTTPNSLLAASFGMSEFGNDHCDRCDQKKYIRRYFHEQHGWILSFCVNEDQCKPGNKTLDVFAVGGSSYYRTWWEDCTSIIALLRENDKKVTLHGYSIGTDPNGNFLFVNESNKTCYVLYGHHLSVY
jgi:hypothetical protein